MKKSLIALAVAGALSTPAFAATSNVDIYGQLDVSVNAVKTDLSGTDDSNVGGVSSNASRFGIKGSEDLGGGLKGIWQIEQTVNMDNDGSGAFGGGGLRNTFLGIAGDAWGSLTAGTIDTPYKSATGRLDMFADTWGDYNTIIGSTDGSFGTFDVREKSSVLYNSPSFSGLSFAAMYGFRNDSQNSMLGNGASDNPKLYSLNAMYANGPLFLSAAYEAHKAAAFSGFNGLDAKAWKAGAGYSIANFLFSGVYEHITTDAGLDIQERNAWMLGAGYTMGNVMLKAQYGKANESNVPAGNDGAKYWVVGADYNLSKRTKVYALYSKLNNDNNGGYVFGGATSDAFTSVVDTSPSVFSLGVRHTF